MRQKNMLSIVMCLFMLFSVSSIVAENTPTVDITPTPEQLAIDSLIRLKSSAPVVPFGDTLFTIYGNIGSISAEQRAVTITENIKALSKTALFNPDSLFIQPDGDNLDIIYNGRTVVGITEIQARLENKSQEELSQEYKELIISAVNKDKSSKRWFVILKRIFLSILLVVVTWFAIKYLNIFYHKGKEFIKKQKERTIEKIYFLFDADQQIRFAVILLNILRLFLIIVILYSCLLTFFRLYPTTEWISQTLLGYVLTPLKIALSAVVNYIPKLISIIVIVLLFRVLIKIIRVIAVQIEHGAITISGFHHDWAMPTFNIVRILLLVFMFIFIFPYLPKSDSKIFQGVSVFMGVLFSLGSTSVISNMVSGIVITYMRPFVLGDRVKMDQYVGDVIEKTPLVTRMRTTKNEIVTIPNSTIMSAHTINYTTSAKNDGLILHTKFAVGYDVDWRKVQALLMDAAYATPHVLKEPAPFVFQAELDDFYAIYEINVYTKEPTKMSFIYSELNKNINEAFVTEGIDMIAAHYSAIRDGSGVGIPEKHVKKGFEFVTPFPVKVVREPAPQPTATENENKSTSKPKESDK